MKERRKCASSIIEHLEEIPETRLRNDEMLRLMAFAHRKDENNGSPLNSGGILIRDHEFCHERIFVFGNKTSAVSHGEYYRAHRGDNSQRLV